MATAIRVRVDIFEAFTGAFRAVFGNLRRFWHTAWPPALLFSGLVTALYLQLFLTLGRRFTEASPPRPEDLFLPIFGPLVVIVIIATLTILAFSVRWTQVLLDPQPAGWLDRRTLRGFGRFLLYYLAMMVGFVFLLALLGAILSVLTMLPGLSGRPTAFLLLFPLLFLGYVGGGLCALRFALLFPAAALDKPLSWATAWRLMHGNTWRLAVTLLALAIVSEIGFMLISLVLELVVVAVGAVLIAGLAAAHVDIAASPALGQAAIVLGSVLLGLFVTAIEFVMIGLLASVPATFYRKIVLEGDRAIPSVF